jgi:extracellular elastinolytic metalloproteinase
VLTNINIKGITFRQNFTKTYMMNRIITIMLLLSTSALAFGNKKADFFEQKAKLYLLEQKATFNLSDVDVANLVVTDQYTDDYSNVTHIWLSQSANGIRLLESSLGLHLSKAGELLYATGDGFLNLQQKATVSKPGMDASKAVETAMSKLGILWNDKLKVQQKESVMRVSFEPISGINDIPTNTELVYTFDESGQLRLVYNIYLDDLIHGSYWDIKMDASTGEIISQRDAIVRCTLGPFHDHGAHDDNYILPETGDNPSTINMRGVEDGSSYRVYPLGVESPIHGVRAVVTNPADPEASPFGWHDTNGSPGPEFTTTRGNNVHAYDDPFGNNNPNFSPNGGASLTFDYPLDFTQPTINDPNRSAAITNLFYWNNVVHDIAYAHGFNEAAGNFQQNNYGKGGRAADIVRAEAQDGARATGGGRNNANFSSPADGSPGRMQMYMWDSRPSSRFVVITPFSIAGTYASGSSVFGPIVYSVSGQAVLASSSGSTLGCAAITSNVSGRIAIIDRGDCEFQQKVQNAQNAGAIGVIIINNVPDEIINMAGENANITIPAVFVTQQTGQLLKNNVSQGLQVSLVGESPTFGNDTDGSFDNGVIAHEYGHGISIRSTGGPLNAGCLTVREQMGEGWSDFYGLALTAKPSHTRTTLRGIGNYAVSFPTTGPGIRQYPFTTNMGVNPHTYDNIKSMGTATGTDVHSVGSVWCAMLWEVYWNLVDAYGFSEDFAHGDKGNNIALTLVTEGLKLQKCNPGFVDGRDAILKADTILYGGRYSCLIWEGFAKRGLGRSATQGQANSLTDNNQAFDVPNCTVLTPPSAQFNTSSIEVCAGQPVSFTNTSSGDITGRQWSFGDGTSSSENSPIKTYPTAGNYTVKLVVVGPGGSDSTTVSVRVKPNPTVEAAGDNSVCSGSPVVLTASGASSYSWSTGATSAQISVSPAATTTYTVTGSTDGCSAQAQKTVTVTALPNVSAGDNKIICVGETVQLTATGASTYNWNTGASAASISVSPSATTTYTVTGTANGCSKEAQVTVTVNPPPTINISPDEQSICAGQSVTLVASGGSTYQWNTGATTASITVSPATTTTYSATAFQGSCSSSGNVTVIVLESPTVVASADVSSCPSESVTLTVSGNATAYTWNTGASGNSITVAPNVSTTYFVTGSNNGTCSRTDSVRVNIRTAPSISLNNNPSICEGGSALLTATIGSDGGEVVWSNSENGTSINVSPAATTAYSATVCSNFCPSLCSTAEVTVNVTPNPIAGFTATPAGLTVSFANTSTGGSTNNWNFGDGNTSTQAAPQHTYTNPGTYTVTLTVKNGDCEDIFQSEVSVVGSSVTESSWIQQFGIYPNPSKGLVTMSLALEKDLRVQVLVYNAVGQMLFAKDLGLMKETVQNFDFSDLPSGSYMLQVLMDDESGVRQMVIVK